MRPPAVPGGTWFAILVAKYEAHFDGAGRPNGPLRSKRRMLESLGYRQGRFSTSCNVAFTSGDVTQINGSYSGYFNGLIDATYKLGQFFYCVRYGLKGCIFPLPLQVCTEMQENTWDRLRESSTLQGRVTQPSPRIFLHICRFLLLI